MPIAMFVVLPVSIVWLIISYEKFAAEKRAQIVLAALEKNPEMDMEVFAQALVPKQKPLRETDLSHFYLHPDWYGSESAGRIGYGGLDSSIALQYLSG